MYEDNQINFYTKNLINLSNQTTNSPNDYLLDGLYDYSKEFCNSTYFHKNNTDYSNQYQNDQNTFINFFENDDHSSNQKR